MFLRVLVPAHTWVVPDKAPLNGSQCRNSAVVMFPIDRKLSVRWYRVRSGYWRPCSVSTSVCQSATRRIFPAVRVRVAPSSSFCRLYLSSDRPVKTSGRMSQNGTRSRWSSFLDDLLIPARNGGSFTIQCYPSVCPSLLSVCRLKRVHTRFSQKLSNF